MNDAYPSISKYARGTYGWAMDQLAAGNEVRRWYWPIEVRGSWETGKNAVYIWHVYKLNEQGGMCKGFSSGVVGADNDYYDGLGVDSMGYRPSDADMDADDWQTVDEVTEKQIAYMDARRVAHQPTAGFRNPHFGDHERRRGNLTVALIPIMFMLLSALLLIFRR